MRDTEPIVEELEDVEEGVKTERLKGNKMIKKKEQYNGKGTKQLKGTQKSFNWLFSKQKFDYIIEIGTGNGMFSIFLAEHSKKMGAAFVTIDIKPTNKRILHRFHELGAEVITCDINKRDVITPLLNKGRILLLIDGALKVPEFIKYAPKLKLKDMIMVHDYYKDRTKPSAGVVIYKDVKKTIQKNAISMIYQNKFDNLLWLCCVK